MKAIDDRITPNGTGETTSISVGDRMVTDMPGVTTIACASPPAPRRSIEALTSSAVSGEPS